MENGDSSFDDILVMAFGAVHHWDGSFDSVAALSASKEHVPTDGTRFAHGNHVPTNGTRYVHGNRVPSDGTRFAQDMRPSLTITVLSPLTT